ncbi:MAG: tRNA epoxyqueuosine(34) reductase QueG [Ignavibacteriae bacterium HGW-Ignavibacteriae-2]|jgi:epoxyqueuosine reductase|nr:MAG: tRNA epoxyqueuosine(34) reductase QueG [Ignavibacteriae bacterium HGW-Ignavibacteriae-2]
MRINNDIVIEIARDAGFTLVGFAPIELLNKEVDKLDKWLLRGFNSGMGYMERNIDKRRDVKLILENAKSVISLGMNYYVDDRHENKMGFGKVSRYAWGKDYHLVIWEKLSDIITQLQEIDENFEAKSYVDTGPVMDKAWAVRAGIGWLGKHTNVINPSSGSWFFIANIFTNYEFEYNKIIADHCGSCTACIDACPTHAIVDEYVVDANKCISNLTIENRGEIPDQFKNNFDNWLFGCDVCQDVCPWNKKFSNATLLDEFKPDGNKQLNLNEIFTMTNSEFKNRFDTSPIKRARLKGLKRNAKFIE